MDAFIVGSLGAWDPENDRTLKSVGIKKKQRKILALSCVVHSLTWGRYVYYSWLNGAKFIQEPDDAQAQVHWLERLLIETKAAAREWETMGRQLPDAFKVPPRRAREGRGQIHEGVRFPNFFLGKPKFFAGTARGTVEAVSGRTGRSYTTVQSMEETDAEEDRIGGEAAGAAQDSRGGHAGVKPTESARSNAQKEPADEEEPPIKPIDIRERNLGDYVPAKLARQGSGCYSTFTYPYSGRRGC